MLEEPDGLSCRHVLVFRETLIGGTGTTTETSLYRSGLSGNHLIEQRIQDRNETTTSVVFLNVETIKRLLPHFQRISEE